MRRLALGAMLLPLAGGCVLLDLVGDIDDHLGSARRVAKTVRSVARYFGFRVAASAPEP